MELLRANGQSFCNGRFSDCVTRMKAKYTVYIIPKSCKYTLKYKELMEAVSCKTIIIKDMTKMPSKMSIWSATPSAGDWEAHRALIMQLYRDENKLPHELILAVSPSVIRAA